MADIRCPMCSEPNPETAEECSFCGARLKPLVLDDQLYKSQPHDHPQSQPPSDEEAAPDWLNRIRARAEEDEDQTEEPVEESDTDWLSRLRSVESDDSGPPEELPDWLEEDQVSEGEEQDEDWLNRLRQTTSEIPEAHEPLAGDSTFDEGEQIESLTDATSEQPLDQDQSLRDLIPEEPEEEVADEVSPLGISEDEPASLDWLEDEIEEEPVEGELPNWFEAEATPSDSDQPLDIDDESADLDQPFEETPGERPDWFDEFERAAEEEIEETDIPEAPVSSIEGDPFEAFEQEGLPDWLDEEILDQAEQFTPETEDTIDEPTPDIEGEEVSGEQPGVDWQEFDWDALAGQEEPEPEPLPEGLGAPPEEQEGLPHVPALIVGDEEVSPPGTGVDEFDLDAIELPDWLSEVDREAGAEVEPEKSGDLAPATIPNWLEAMRPVETFQPVVEIESEEERAVESVGPLAGLRGVLLAEPVVAKPRTSTAVGERLSVTESQYAQADILRRIVEREDRERVGGRDRGKGLPLVRWLISLVLVAAVLIPPLTGIPRFAPPERVSRDLGSLLEVVNTIESGQPALVVFDYEPGYSAELEAVSSAMIEDMMARGVNVVTLSTRTTGPPLALNLIDEVGEPHEIENGRDYLHLGYLSGGPTAIQLFSIAPKEAILKGFMLPTDLEIQDGWEAPILRNVERLSDFGLVAVITAGTDNARTWAEQAHPWLEDTPMVMVLSAGAEPMIRPYFESLNPQIDGILTGLPAAVAYEQINNRAGQAQERWDAFGSGALAVEIILAAGLVYGLISWVIERRRKAEQE